MTPEFAEMQTHVLIVIPRSEEETRVRLQNLYTKNERLVVFADNLLQAALFKGIDTGAVLIFKSVLDESIIDITLMLNVIMGRYVPVLFVTGYTPNSYEGMLIEAL